MNTWILEIPKFKITIPTTNVLKRPSLHIEEIPQEDGSFTVGETKWEPLSVIVQSDHNEKSVFDYLSEHYQMGTQRLLGQLTDEQLNEYKTDVMIHLYQDGKKAETWTLCNALPKSVCFDNDNTGIEEKLIIDFVFDEVYYKAE